MDAAELAAETGLLGWIGRGVMGVVRLVCARLGDWRGFCPLFLFGVSVLVLVVVLWLCEGGPVFVRGIPGVACSFS